MKASSRCLLILALSLPIARAHDIITTKLTYTRDISRIFERRCIACHAGGSSIPLATFEQVRPWAVDIKQQVLSRAMPPWGAVKGFGDLAPDHGLSEEEIMIIAAWVIGGAPEGNPALLPKASAAAALKTPTPCRDAVVISTRRTLEKSIVLTAVRPMVKTPVTSARIVAVSPDGRVEPLVWLFDYDPAWRATFRFRRPLVLSPGTVVQSDAPLEYALETSQ